MNRISFLFLILIIVSCKNEEKQNAPNVIYILADDLGYGELGCYGQMLIETPNIDALAERGMRFTQHYAGAPVCAPSRCILLTGQHGGHAYVRGNDEWKERGNVWDYQAMFEDPYLEGQRPLADSIVTIGEVMQQNGYVTACVGKWGLGAPGSEGAPNNQGFDFFYGYNCQRQAHNLYPTHLWKNDERHLLKNKLVAPHVYFPKDADPNNSENYADYNLEEYAPTLMHVEALNFIDKNKEQPFFLYYASPLPHLPLQAPGKWVNYYREKLGDEEPYADPQKKSYFPNQYPRATYAAMISYLDEQVGEIVEKLKELGLYENTLIVFSSDNGPTYTGGADTPFFDSAKPFKTEYGWGKGFVHEGGLRVPMIASWPDKIQAGTVSESLSVFYDIFPTVCDLLGAEVPVNIDGQSLLPVFFNQDKNIEANLYWEFSGYNGQQAVRLGKWKGIRKNLKDGNLAIELYDLENDIQEQFDVSEKYPEVVDSILTIMLKSHETAELEAFRIPVLDSISLINH